MSKLLVRSKKTRSCKLMLLVIIVAPFVFNMAISSIQKNFHSPVDPPNQSQRPQHPQLYTAELAAKAVEPTVWTCGKADRQKGGVVDPITNQRPFFAFIHVYKTGGSSVRKFLQEYATTCEKSLRIAFFRFLFCLPAFFVPLLASFMATCCSTSAKSWTNVRPCLAFLYLQVS